MAGVRSLVVCEFNEDEFQALAFAELANRFRGIAVGGPFIEDRRAERRHGVDAWVRLRHAGRLTALFLQYKVPKLVVSTDLEPPASNIHGGKPYLRFKLHQDSSDRKAGAADTHRQHNNLVRLRKLTGQPAYYCAPAYIEWGQLLRAFYRGDIYGGCLLGDPAAIGRVRGRDTHYITYSTDLSTWAFHSEPRMLGRPTAWERALSDETSQEWTSETLDELASEIERLDVEEAPSNEPAWDDGERRRDDKDRRRDDDAAQGPDAVLRLAHAASRVLHAVVVFVPEQI